MPDCAKTIYIDSIEVLEQKYPIRFRSLRLMTDSGGAGASPRRARQRDRVRPRARDDAGVLLRRLRPQPAGRRARRGGRLAGDRREDLGRRHVETPQPVIGDV